MTPLEKANQRIKYLEEALNNVVAVAGECPAYDDYKSPDDYEPSEIMHALRITSALAGKHPGFRYTIDFMHEILEHSD